MEIYEEFVGDDPRKVPMQIFPSVHYSMGGIWVDPVSYTHLIPDAEIIFWDERLSTVAADRYLLEADVSRAKRKKVIDKMAAVFILQGYLDSLK